MGIFGFGVRRLQRYARKIKFECHNKLESQKHVGTRVRAHLSCTQNPSSPTIHRNRFFQDDDVIAERMYASTCQCAVQNSVHAQCTLSARWSVRYSARYRGAVDNTISSFWDMERQKYTRTDPFFAFSICLWDLSWFVAYCSPAV